LLGKLAAPLGVDITADTLDTHTNYHQMVWLDHASSANASRYMHPGDSGLDNYYYADTFANSALLLQLSFTNSEKTRLLINFIQLGIDLYSFIESGAAGWYPDGGHATGRKWPIMFAGIMLNYAPMRDIGAVSGDYLYSNGHGAGDWPTGYKSFGEDGQTFYVSQSDVDITNGPSWNPDKRNSDYSPYNAAMIGMPEWGIRYSTHQNKSDSSWAATYRFIGTGAQTWAGTTMAARIMGAKKLWNHNAHFDYVDRYMAISNGDVAPLGYKVTSERKTNRPGGLIGGMWDTYRNDF
jgi:hypothetical protein